MAKRTAAEAGIDDVVQPATLSFCKFRGKNHDKSSCPDYHGAAAATPAQLAILLREQHLSEAEREAIRVRRRDELEVEIAQLTAKAIAYKEAAAAMAAKAKKIHSLVDSAAQSLP